MGIRRYLYIFLISMVPIIELRGAIPFGNAAGLDPILTFIICVLGNCLPVPIILLFIRKVIAWMKTTKRLSSVALFLERRAEKKKERVMKYASLGLFLFVAIPLPGTGAWTGALVAALMDMRFKYALPSICAGVVTAGVLVTLICRGVLGFLSFML